MVYIQNLGGKLTVEDHFTDYLSRLHCHVGEELIL